MKQHLPLLLVLCSVINVVSCFFIPGDHIRRKLAAIQQAVKPLPEKYGPFWYDQPVDHFLENSTTFKHRYWTNTDWYQPGGPVILYNAGEDAADSRSFYVTNSSMAQLAQRLNGIILVMEHRFYGLSLPSSNFTAENLATLNTAQALEDMASFIKYIKFPNLELAPDTKYIVYGGSYSGNLAAWMRLKYPDIVFAAVPSSAPVQMKYNFHEYFDPIIEYGPDHCIRAIEHTIDYVDSYLFTFSEQEKTKMKAIFGLQDLKHDDDFAEILSYPLGLWQSMSPSSNPFEENFCSIFKGLTTPEEFISAYGNYTKSFVKDACQGEEVNKCLDTHDPQNARYVETGDESRVWYWQVCTEYAYWQTAAPLQSRSVVSRKLQTSWYQHQCPLMFGEHSVPSVPKWAEINQEYQGWFVDLDRVFWIDGEWDPWRTLSVQSENGPQRANSGNDAAYAILPKSVHHWDFYPANTVSDDVKQVQNDVYDKIKLWLNNDREAKQRVHIQNPY